MPPAAPVRELITVLAPLVALALVTACKEPADPITAPAPTRAAAAPADATTPARPVGQTAPADATTPAETAPPPDAEPPPEPRNQITLTLSPPRTPGSELARRCRLEGDPLSRPCAGRGRGLAVAPDGTLYVVAGNEVRRYTRTDDDGCRYTPRGAPITLPPDKPRSQNLGGGSLYMRSGGPAWHLARSGSAIYAVDFLAGLYRLDGDTPRPACTEVFGYDHLATHRGKLLVARRSIEQLVLGKRGRCKTVPTAYPTDRRRGDLHVVDDQLYLVAGRDVTRYDGTTATKLADDHLCFVTDVTACGDDVCLLDNNCMKLVQLDRRGEVIRTLDGHALFATHPLAVSDAVTLDNGAVLLRASHRDTTAGQETCEDALYELPAAVFAR